MSVSLAKAILILPGTALVYVPGLILWLTRDSAMAASFAGPATIRFWIGIAAIGPGLVLAVWTVRLFTTVGEGTPAPWDPPKKFVVTGPYRHVRNPMIVGVLFLQLAEALVLSSWPLAGWMVFFFILNNVYFQFSEEVGLERRFGNDYSQYKAHVSRWVPRWTPYLPEHAGENHSTTN